MALEIRSSLFLFFGYSTVSVHVSAGAQLELLDICGFGNNPIEMTPVNLIWVQKPQFNIKDLEIIK